MKKCSKCHQQLPLERFHKNRSVKDGLNLYCRTCSATRQRAFLAKHPGYQNPYNAKWQRNNRALFHQLLNKYFKKRYREDPEFREKLKVRSKSGYYFPIRQVCSHDNCQELGERHHSDFTDHLGIIWLCGKHHRVLHKNLSGVV